MATLKRTVIDANDLSFDALSAGPIRGELVLLLHGFPQSSACWRQALATLGDAGYHAVAPDQRGYSAGANPDGVDAYTVAALSDDVLALASALGAERFHLIGHDWGGTVAWVVAEREPQRLLSLTAVSTPHTAALAEALRTPQQRARMAYIPVLRLPRIGEALIDAAGGAIAERMLTATGLSAAHAHRDVAHVRQVGSTGPLNWYRAIGRGAIPRPRAVSTPTLYVWSDGDPVFTREAMELTAQHVAGPYHVLELEGGSHWIPDQHWDDVSDVVVDHLRANAARPRSATRRPAKRKSRTKAAPLPAPESRSSPAGARRSRSARPAPRSAPSRLRDAPSRGSAPPSSSTAPPPSDVPE